MSPRPNRTRPAATSSLTPNVEPIGVAGTTTSPPSGRTPVVTDSETADLPKYQQMIRKEARLRPDQVDVLAQLRRRVTRGRGDRTETITDNTLIRIEVDLLLERGEQLAGDTEDQLRDSVTTPE